MGASMVCHYYTHFLEPSPTEWMKQNTKKLIMFSMEAGISDQDLQQDYGTGLKGTFSFV